MVPERELVQSIRNDMLSERKTPSVAALCRALGVARSSAYYEPRNAAPVRCLDKEVELLIYEIIQRFPMFGIRRVWAYLKYRMDVNVNRKKVWRIMKLRGWTMNKRRVGWRPRVDVSRSIAERPDRRWATDIALAFCGETDGWCAFVPVLDCCTREVLGWELSRTARAKTAERALEAALIGRFGWVHGAPDDLVIRHDNGLVFGSKLYRGIVHEYGISQEYITPYTPEENGLVERFIRSFKEECVWQNRFENIEEARRVIGRWISWYNDERPHESLGYKSPVEYRKFLECGAAA